MGLQTLQFTALFLLGSSSLFGVINSTTTQQTATTTPLSTSTTTATLVSTTKSVPTSTTMPMLLVSTTKSVPTSTTTPMLLVSTTKSVPTSTTTPMLLVSTTKSVSTATTTPMLTSTTSTPAFNCTVHGCTNGGTCEADGTCLCSGWMTGNRCTEYIRCPDSYCDVYVDGGRNCTVENGTPVCQCNDGYAGDKCETRDWCYSVVCENNGTCVPTPTSHICHCVTGDPAGQCALNSDNPCQINPPQGADSYITCIDLIRAPPYRMVCRPGRGGDNCGQHIDPSDQCRDCDDEGYCKPLCKYAVCNATDNCNFTISPFPAQNDTASMCQQTFANGYADPGCVDEAYLFDGFDGIRGGDHPIRDCSPFFDTICTRNVSDGICNPHCNNSACLYDGLDCIPGRSALPTLNGTVVVDLIPNRFFSAYSYFSLLLRSGVMWETEESTTRKSVYLKIVRPSALVFGSSNVTSIGQFTSVESVGRFLSAAIAKLPLSHIVGVTDVWVCEAGKYNRDPDDRCSLTCSANCLPRGDVCHSRTGNCLHGCATGWWGEKCNSQCHANCIGGCRSDDGHCTACERAKYGAECQLDCDHGCVTYACDVRTGRCNCGPSHFWSAKTARCAGCSSGCVDNGCSGSDGACRCSPGNYGARCDRQCPNCLPLNCNQDNGYCDNGCQGGYHGDLCEQKCPEGCPECERAGGQCIGQCKPGYVGRDCKRSVEPRESGSSTGVTIAIVMAVIIAIVIAIFVFCYCRRRKQSGDYILEDEINSPVPQADTLEVKNSVVLQPVSHVAVSGDLIEMDEKLSAGVYAGPDRQPVSQNQQPSPSPARPADIVTVIISDETKLISEGKEIKFARDDEVIVTADVSNEEQAPDSTTDEDPALISEDDLMDDDPVVTPGVFLSVSVDRAPIASQEDLTAASLEDVTKMDERTTETAATVGDNVSDQGSTRKHSSTSSSVGETVGDNVSDQGSTRKHSSTSSSVGETVGDNVSDQGSTRKHSSSSSSSSSSHSSTGERVHTSL